MPIQYPAALDALPKPAADTFENASGFEHDVVHSDLATAIEALQAKVGVDESEVATSLDHRVAALEAAGGTPTAQDYVLLRNTATGAVWKLFLVGGDDDTTEARLEKQAP